jgi:uncharacterized membrane protein (UPF0136 family)
VAGAALDFASGYTMSPMNEGMAPSYLGEEAMYALGVLVLVVGLFSFLRAASDTMKWSGAAMGVLGFVMILASGLVPGMNAAISDSMLIVGGLMIVNGIIMQRSGKAWMK